MAFAQDDRLVSVRLDAAKHPQDLAAAIPIMTAGAVAEGLRCKLCEARARNSMPMKAYLFAAAAALCFAACDVNVPPAEKNTTIVNPPAEKKETNTTIVNPPAEKKTESTTTTTETKQ